MNKTLVLVVALVVLAVFILRALGQARPDEARALLKNGGRVIDVRTAAEFEARHLDLATNIPLDQLRERITREIPDLDTPLLLHCASGARSASAQRMLQAMGYRSVVNLGSYRRAANLTQP